jgi:hypothetical protein
MRELFVAENAGVTGGVLCFRYIVRAALSVARAARAAGAARPGPAIEARALTGEEPETTNIKLRLRTVVAAARRPSENTRVPQR